MTSAEEQRGGTIYDYPNRQVLGLAPPWVDAEEPATPAGRSASDLDDLTKEEMLERARQLGVSPANNAMTKDELRAGIEEASAGVEGG